MHNLIKTIATKLNATETEASQAMQEIRAELADFIAKLKQEADIALTKAREVFEEVAGRGFPDHDFTAQSAKLREAQAEVSKADELGAAVANIVEPAPSAPVEVAPVVEPAQVEPVGDAPFIEPVEPTLVASAEPAPSLVAPVAPVDPTPVELAPQ